MPRHATKKHKIAIVPHDDGTVSVAIAIHRYRFKRAGRGLKWSLAVLNEALDFLYEPVPGVQIQPRLLLRIEGRPHRKNRQRAWEKIELHRIRRKNKPLW
jgi:hypothetical protein